MTTETDRIDETVPHESREGLGNIGWIGINILLLAIVGTMLWGVVVLFWMALVLTPIVFAVIFLTTTNVRPRLRRRH